MSDSGTKKMTICEEARVALRPGFEKTAFAALTGVSFSTITNREKVDAKITGTASTLYYLIRELSARNLETMITKALEAVPPDERSEGRAVMELVALAYQSGNAAVVHEAQGRSTPEIDAEEEGEGMDRGAAAHLKSLKIRKETYERMAHRYDGEAREEYLLAANDISSAMIRAERARRLAQQTNESESQSADEVPE